MSIFYLFSEGEPQSLIKAIKDKKIILLRKKGIDFDEVFTIFLGDNQTLEIYRMSIGTDSKLGVVVWFSYLMGWREIY